MKHLRAAIIILRDRYISCVCCGFFFSKYGICDVTWQLITLVVLGLDRTLLAALIRQLSCWSTLAQHQILDRELSNLLGNLAA